MSKREAFSAINVLIEEGNGRPLTLNSKLIESELDSLGYLLLLLGMDKAFGILKDTPEGQELSHIDIEATTMKQLVNRCVISKCQK